MKDFIKLIKREFFSILWFGLSIAWMLVGEYGASIASLIMGELHRLGVILREKTVMVVQEEDAE